MIIIGFSGKMQSGKNTAADAVSDYVEKAWFRDYTTIQTSFARPIKQIVLRLFVPSKWNWNVDKLNKNKDTLLPTVNKTVRETLQWFGTDVCRVADESTWVRLWRDLVCGFVSSSPVGCPYECVILVTDVRFKNEIIAIHQLGGHVIKMLRCPVCDSHESESALPIVDIAFDAIIDNREMSVEEMQAAVVSLIIEKKWIRGK